MTLSKFDREQLEAQERATRKNNIGIIEARLAEARGIYEVVQTDEERQTVGREIHKLEGMLADERKAYDTAGVTREDVNAIVAEMRI